MTQTILTITEANLEALVKTQNEILQILKSQQNYSNENSKVSHITAKEFMDRVHIRRTKFDQLVAENRIRIVKKRRRIYVPVGEVYRYFNDSSIR